MKKLLLPICALVLVSCTNDADFSSENISDASIENKTSSMGSYFEDFENSDLIEFDFETIGVEHNLGLEYIYSDIYSNSMSFGGYTVAEQDGFVKNSITYYMNNSYYSGNLSASHMSTLLNTINLADNVSLKLDSLIRSNLNSSTATEIYEKILSNLDEYAEDQYITVADYEEMGRELEIDLEYELNAGSISKEEYFALRSMVVVSIHSLNYWDTNYVNWESMLGSESLASKGGPDWERLKKAGVRMGKADLAGAGVGLVWGGVYGMLGGPGGALLGAASTAVGMGLNGSAMAGIRELF